MAASSTSSPAVSTRDTPVVEHQTTQSSYRTGDLLLGRIAVLEDLGRYRQVSYDYLISTVFGPAPSASDISHVRKKLEDARVLKNGRWADFPNTPSKSKLSEGDTFEPLGSIISQIFSQVDDCKFSVAANPSRTPFSERPDSYIHLNEWLANEEKRSFDPDKIHWFDIAIPFEFKKAGGETTRLNEKGQMIWSLHHIMREDPCRRFALGITIEDTQMRLWCSSRTLLAVSIPIDFVTRIDDIISLFYLIGTRTYVQLGWDPTVKRICENGKFQYKFKIGDEIFTTIRAISTFGADAMVGSGTRVYEVKDKDGKIVAIKDYWRDETRDPEGLIMEQILEDIGDKLGEKEADEAKRYFVAIRMWSDVVIAGMLDKTFDLGKDHDHLNVGLVPGLEYPPFMQRGIGERSDGIQCRIHARTVFDEVGLPLMNITHLSKSLACLSGGQKALYYLHRTGWVHRDFSVTNVLWFEKDGWGKLTDVEYAKKVDSKGSHDVRTGTMHFMALEVEHQKYIFKPQLNPNKRKRDASPSKPPFHMNYLHDLESEWWAAIWVLFYHTDKGSPCSKPNEQLKWFCEAFPGIIGLTSRNMFFTNHEDRDSDAVKTLSDTYRQACTGIIDLARDLHSCYLEMEESYPEIKHDDNLLEAIHKKLSDAHSHAIEELSGSNIQLLPVKQFLTKKRA